jgi:hypothetical protein
MVCIGRFVFTSALIALSSAVALPPGVTLPPTDSAANTLRWLDRADVHADFRRHVIKQHDTRFVGVYGLSVSIPGVDAATELRVLKNRRFRVIEGTSDVVTSEEYDRLLDKAYDYAKRYNSLLLGYLRERKKT